MSSSHCVAIGALAPPTALHVAYVHSTMRYTREGQPTYEASVPGGRLGRAVFRGTAHYLRRWEVEASARPHVLIANSSYTRDRIRRYYRRDAQIIEPPIETSRFAEASPRGTPAGRDAPFLLVSALVPNKRIDLALRAFHGRSDRLVVVGDGPERGRLERLLGPNVTLLPRVEEAELASLFAECRALLHPGVDDFGMVMVEALAAGKPVLACAEGGALDIVRDGETGLFIESPTVEAVRATLDRFASHAGAFDADTLRAFARRFDRSHFERRFAAAVEAARDAYDGRRAASADAIPSSIFSATGKAEAQRTELPRDTPSLVREAGQVGEADVAPAPPRAALPPASTSRIKRTFDVVIAASGLVLASPLLAVFGAAIALGPEGAPLFYQRRVGLDQEPFTLVKLRTMDASGEVTPVGRWLRPLGVDEIPQLWNVLRGDMSLIGPRPEVPVRVERYRRELEGYDARHLVRPGITGLAQVRGLRGDHSGTIADRLLVDLEYVREWSLAMDLGIALATAPRVLSDTFQSLRG